MSERVHISDGLVGGSILVFDPLQSKNFPLRVFNVYSAGALNTRGGKFFGVIAFYLRNGTG